MPERSKPCRLYAGDGNSTLWFNKGDRRYYLGASRDCTVPGTPCPAATQQTAVLGVIDARTNLLIEKIPQSSNSHSVAADSERNLIFVPQVAPVAVVGAGGDTTNVGAGICGTSQGCVAVYRHRIVTGTTAKRRTTNPGTTTGTRPNACGPSHEDQIRGRGNPRPLLVAPSI